MRRTLCELMPDVPSVGLGGAPLSIPPCPSEAEAKRVIRRALELGVGLIDTADVYCTSDADRGHNERLIRAVLAEAPSAARTLVATKGGCTRPGGGWGEDGRPVALRRACEASLRALGVEQIALYQLHAPDPSVPLAESVGELARLREEGKILAIGLSNVSLPELREALSVAPIVSVQNRLNPLDLTALHDGVLAECESRGLGFIAYSPLGGRDEIAEVRAHSALRSAAREVAATVEQVALAWILSLGERVFVIPGATRPESVESSVFAGSLQLSPATLAALDRAFGAPGRA